MKEPSGKYGLQLLLQFFVWDHKPAESQKETRVKSKTKMKLMVLMLTLVLAVVALSGCGSSTEPTRETTTKEEGTGFPMTVTDATGAQMTIETKPESVLSMTLGSDEMLLTMVDPAKIKALSGKISEDAGISNVADRAVEFVKAENNIETILSLDPDIVLAASWLKQESIQQLRDANILVYCYETPNNIQQQKEVILVLGTVLGEEAKAQSMVEEMEARIGAVAEKVSSIKVEDRLTVLTYNSSELTDGKDSMFEDVANQAGVINLPSLEGYAFSDEISKEKIIEMNPDILILPSWSYDPEEDPAEFAEQIKNDPSFASINAVKNHRVYQMEDKHLVAVSQYIVLGVEDLAKIAYPELFQ